VVEVPKTSEWVLMHFPVPDPGAKGAETSIYFTQFELRPRQGECRKTRGKARKPLPAPGGTNVKGGSDDGTELEQWSFGFSFVSRVPYYNKPDWPNQINRFLVPCCENPQKHWVRQAKGISLGQLFWHHGHRWSAKSLYMFYQSCRVLALKQTRTKSSGAVLWSKYELKQRVAGST